MKDEKGLSAFIIPASSFPSRAACQLWRWHMDDDTLKKFEKDHVKFEAVVPPAITEFQNALTNLAMQ